MLWPSLGPDAIVFMNGGDLYRFDLASEATSKIPITIGDDLPAAGAAVTVAGEQVGTVTSPVRSPEVGQPIGLSLIHRKASDPGTPVEVAGVGEAKVTELPFVSAGVA